MKILVIEDEPDILDNISEVLVSEGHEVLTAKDGAIGLEVAKSQLPNLVICDLMLPEIDGHAVVAELRGLSEFRDTPIIIMSGKAGHQTIEDTLKKGASAFIKKPFNIDSFIALIGEYDVN